MHGWMIAGMGLWGLLVVLTWVAVLVVAVLGGLWLFRRLRGGDAAIQSVRGDMALDTLRQRYAAGEIDDEEYQRRLTALT